MSSTVRRTPVLSSKRCNCNGVTGNLEAALQHITAILLYPRNCDEQVSYATDTAIYSKGIRLKGIVGRTSILLEDFTVSEPERDLFRKAAGSLQLPKGCISTGWKSSRILENAACDGRTQWYRKDWPAPIYLFWKGIVRPLEFV
jgi:hypothetical protein